MKRSALILPTALITVALVAGGAFCFWLLETADGARWLLRTVGTRSGLEVSMDRVDGRLSERLDIDNLRIAWNDGAIEAGSLQLTWQPWKLLGGRLRVQSLVIDRLTLQSTGASTNGSPPSETVASDTETKLAISPDWLTVTIDRLEIAGFFYRDPVTEGDGIVIADRIAGRYRLADQRLSGEGFAYHSPYVQLDGTLEWELTRPHLAMSAEVYLPPSCVDPGLFETIGVPVRFPGEIELEGTWEGFRGPVRFGSNDGQGGTVWLSATADGSWRGLRLEDLQAGYLHGSLAGNLDLAWIDDYRMHGTLAGQGLRFGDLVAELQGAIDLSVSGELFVPYDDGPLTARLAADISSALVHGQLVRGKAAASWQGSHATSLDIDLRSQSAHLLAQGIPAERVAVELTADDLGGFHRELVGSLDADGWVRWAEDALTGELVGQATDFSWRALKAGHLDFSASHPVADAALAIRIDGQQLQYREWQLATFAARISGTPARHSLRLQARGEQGNVQGRLAGRYQDQRWDGLLQELTGQMTPWGNWQLEETAKILLEPDNLRLETLHLGGDEGADVRLEELQWQPAQGLTFDLAWSAFRLGWLGPLLEFKEFNGRTDGRFTVTGGPSGPVSMTGHLQANGNLAYDAFTLDYRDLAIDLRWAAGGLKLTASAESDRAETLSVAVVSDLPPAWDWPADLVLDASWQQLALDRLNHLFGNATLEGSSTGQLHLETAGRRARRISARINADGHLNALGEDLGSRSLVFDLHWGAQRFTCETRLNKPSGNVASLRLASSNEPQFAWPETGQIKADISNLQLALLKPWLPENLELVGRLDGQLDGAWKNQREISLNGQLALEDSKLRWALPDGQLLIPLRQGTLGLQWQDEHLTGTLAMNLGDKGRLESSWQLPLPARLPLGFERQKPVRASLTASMRALGLLSLFGPWTLQDLQGNIEAELSLDGTWAAPKLGGALTLNNGGGYLPATGARLEDVALRAELAGDRILLKDLVLRSGEGDMTGEGEITLDQWRLAHYRLDLSGKNLQVYDFPEIRAVVNPDLKISGDPGLLVIRGDIMVPQLLIRADDTGTQISASKDVTVVRPVEAPESHPLPFKTDARVNVSLGEDVRIRAQGFRTRLEGGGTVTLDAEGHPRLSGEIRLVEGSYRAYGTDLMIRQGILRYKDDPIDNPQLSILAIRETGNVKAGVQVGGNAENPTISLYSQPAMPERDIISYMLTGQATKRDGANQEDLMIGAGTLLPGESLSQFGMTEVLLRGVYVGTGGVRLRYRLADRWELESTLGTESGVDLYYIFEFD